jgi:3-dehydroquinate synthase
MIRAIFGRIRYAIQRSIINRIPFMQGIQLQFDLRYSFPVVFTRDAFNPDNHALSDVLKQTGCPNKVLVVIDSNVAAANPRLINTIEAYSRHHASLMDIVAPPYIITGGEACKNNPDEVQQILSLINTYHLCRHSFVMAIGGGAVLDAVGFATATAHRGLRLLRLPTTTLAQNDAGVGVKNSMNMFGKKNFIGTFAPPFAVINDLDFLDTLQARDRRAGIAEAIKVALIKDRAFFDFLYDNRDAMRDFESHAMAHMIARCAELHIDHIRTNGDPFEQGASRPLDFGHWAAHKIEDLADDDVRHGEAVAVGIVLDSLYSCHCGLISELELHKILSLIKGVGFRPFHPALHKMDVQASLNDFQEHMGGELTIPLLKGIGSLTEVHHIDTNLVASGIQFLAGKYDRKNALQESQQASHGGKTGTGHTLP